MLVGTATLGLSLVTVTEIGYSNEWYPSIYDWTSSYSKEVRRVASRRRGAGVTINIEYAASNMKIQPTHPDTSFRGITGFLTFGSLGFLSFLLSGRWYIAGFLTFGSLGRGGGARSGGTRSQPFSDRARGGAADFGPRAGPKWRGCCGKIKSSETRSRSIRIEIFTD